MTTGTTGGLPPPTGTTRRSGRLRGQLIEVVPDLDLVVVVSCTIPDGPVHLDASTFRGLVDAMVAPAIAP